MEVLEATPSYQQLLSDDDKLCFPSKDYPLRLHDGHLVMLAELIFAVVASKLQRLLLILHKACESLYLVAGNVE